MKVIKQIIIGVITVVALIFAAQNFEVVEIVFLKYSIQLPIAVVVFAIYILGAFSGGMLWSLIKKVATMDKASKNPEQKSEADEAAAPAPKPKPGFFSDSE